LADCKNKYSAETSGVATLSCLRLQHCLQQVSSNAAVAVVTSIQLGINQFILKPIIMKSTKLKGGQFKLPTLPTLGQSGLMDVA
jgi:hypothetical protein